MMSRLKKSAEKTWRKSCCGRFFWFRLKKLEKLLCHFCRLKNCENGARCFCATSRNWIGGHVAFCHGQKMSWRTRGVLPLPENELASEWRFATSRKWVGEWMAFRHCQKKAWRVNGISPRIEKSLSSWWQHWFFLFFPLPENHFLFWKSQFSQILSLTVATPIMPEYFKMKV